MFVAHGFLDGADVGAAVEAMGGVGVAEVVRGDVEAQWFGGGFDGALDVGFVAAPADSDASAGVLAGLAGGE